MVDNVREIEISGDQTKIIEAGFEKKILVVAGPGSGKTFTLIHRIRHLVKIQNLSPSSEILVLSFSRAAISEVRKRIKASSDNSSDDYFHELNIFTFDSFATRLLFAANDDFQIQGNNFDHQIKLATKQLSDPNSYAADMLSGLRHVIIDEVQDLIDPRVSFVMRILENLEGGFTLLGDPAQGIFDYQIKENTGALDSDRFLSWVKEKWKNDLEIIEPDINFRSVPEIEKITVPIRQKLLGEDSHKALIEIKDLIGQADLSGSVLNISPDVLYHKIKTVAVLCRKNEEVMICSLNLGKSDLQFYIPPSIEERGVPSWLGRILSGWHNQEINSENFKFLWDKEITDFTSLTSEKAWSILKSIERRESRMLDIHRLKQYLKSGIKNFFDTDITFPENQVITMNIHQSKGREFDHVVILQPEIYKKMSDRDKALEGRVYYVAMTRAREKISRINRNGMPRFRTIFYHYKKRRLFGQSKDGSRYFQVLPDDMDFIGFVSKKFIGDLEIIQRIQDFLWKCMKPGMKLNLKPVELDGKISYYLNWQKPGTKKAITLGMLNQDFSYDLKKFCDYYYPGNSENPEKKYHLTPHFQSLTLLEIVTVNLPLYSEFIHKPYASSGFALGFTVKGMLQFPPK
ncbi:MAG: UvrD-helicase domain-containing protein [Anaerolineaceae bacterium]|nr:UvrD-helicase domain-containing protein [Anaerolineaceae bacterium]